MRILAIAAHADDETFAAGGTLARHAADGDEVSILILCSSDEIRKDRPHGAEWRDQARAACAAMKAQRVNFCHLPGQKLDNVPLLSILTPIEDYVKKCEPTIIYSHAPGDINQDHRRAYEAVKVAVRPSTAPTVEALYGWEVPSSTELGDGFKPDMFVKIDWSQKLAALNCYPGELQPDPWSRSIASLEARAKYWGSHVGFEHAEVFRTIWRRR